MATPPPVAIRLLNPLTRNSKVIAWSAPAGSPMVGFNVYRSITPSFADAFKLNVDPVTVTFYEDFIQDSIEDEAAATFYFVTSIGAGNVESVAGPANQEFDPFTPKPRKSSVMSMRRVGDEMRRRHGKILQFDGETGHYLVRKSAGELAQDYDPLRRDAPYRSGQTQAGNPNAEYGTRFKGGYFVVPNVRWRWIPTTQRLSREEMGLTTERKPTIWVVDFPLLTSRDIIVRQNNERYRIVNVTPQSLGGRITRQVATLEYLEPSDVIYNLVVPEFVDPNNPVAPTEKEPTISNPAKLPDKSSN